MLTAETKRRLDACRDVLVGKLPLPTDQIELITLALIYKFMDDLDEESVKLGGKRSFFTGPLEKYRWRALLPQKVSAEERMNLFAEGIEGIGKGDHLPALFRDIFRNSFLKFRDGRILTLFLNEINGFVYSHSEELGNAFEYLLKTMGIQAENGQFRTPRHIIDFMVACLDPQPSDRILDPACGTGGFLVSCYKHIFAQHTSPGSTIAGDKLTHEQRQKVYSNLTGYDVTDLMVKLSKVNLFLHGFPDPAIHIYDTLTNDARWNEKADLILANPPFMTPKGGVSPHTKFRVAARKTEVLFTDYIAEHLAPDGRGGVIVPNGIVATTQNAYVKLRRFLIEDSLVAVISLPAGVFKPYSGVKTSILFLDKKLSRKVDKILFVKINADGFDLGEQRNPIEANDLPEARRLVTAWVHMQSLSKTDLAAVLISKRELLSKPDASLRAPGDRNGTVEITDYETLPLAEIAEIQLGKMLDKTKHRTGKLLPYLRNVNIRWGKVDTNDLAEMYFEDHELERFSLRPGDVLVCEGGEPGRAAVWDGRLPQLKYQKALHRVRFKIPFEPQLLVHYLQTLATTGDLDQYLSGTTIKHLTREVFARLPIPVIPLDEQRRIVAEIEAVHASIARLESEIAENRKRITAIVDNAWFR